MYDISQYAKLEIKKTVYSFLWIIIFFNITYKTQSSSSSCLSTIPTYPPTRPRPSNHPPVTSSWLCANYLYIMFNNNTPLGGKLIKLAFNKCIFNFFLHKLALLISRNQCEHTNVYYSYFYLHSNIGEPS